MEQTILKEEIVEMLKNTMDPELHIDIWTLGLIYNVDYNEKNGTCIITMTFTTPFCPYGPQMVGEIKSKLRALGLGEVTVNVVFDPPWEPSTEVREMLGV